MAHRTVHLTCLVSLLAFTLGIPEQGRWSRQLSSYTSDISDWVPLRGPIERKSDSPQPPQIKRQAVAEPRILTEPFPGMSNVARPSAFNTDLLSRNYWNMPANRQLYLQSVPSVPSAPQNYLTEQGFGQSIRFGLSQPNFPLSQGFVAPSPPFAFDNIQPPKPARPQGLVNIINQNNFPQALGAPPSVQPKPFLTPQKLKPDPPKFVDGYRVENASSNFGFSHKKPQSLQKIKFEGNEKVKQEVIPQHSKSERGEEVQLLYVPVDHLNRGQYNFKPPSQTQQFQPQESFIQSLTRPDSGKQVFLNGYVKQGEKPLDIFSGQNYFSNFNSQFKNDDKVGQYSTIAPPFVTQAPTAATTIKPKKLKPHQPPLAIFMTKDPSKRTAVKVGDVLSTLKNAETIAVLDSVNPLNAPKVFIGPSNLPPPENFVKFELPYLSNIEDRESKLKQLPFFVAPLSYNTPNGFAKIPFPSPHVGSVVINSQIKEMAQPQTFPPAQPSINPNYYTVPPIHKNENQLNTQKPLSYSQPSISGNYYTDIPPSQKAEVRPVSQKPMFSFYTTSSPNTKPVQNYQSNYYSFEPQTVSSIRPPLPTESQSTPAKTSFFLTKPNEAYNSQDILLPPQNNFRNPETVDQYNYQRQPEQTTSLRPPTITTSSTTTKPPSTYPSQLLETHNPYSINQAFHFSTPLDYHNYFEDFKQPYNTPSPVRATPATPPSTSAPLSPSSPNLTNEKVTTEKSKYYYQTSPSYLNNYSPEIHYDSDPNLKYPVYNPNDYTSKPEVTSQQNQPSIVDANDPINKGFTYQDTQNPYNPNVASHDNQYTNVESTVNAYNKYNTNNDTTVNNIYKTEAETPYNSYNVRDNNEETYHIDYNLGNNNGSSSEIVHLPKGADLDTLPKLDDLNTHSSENDAESISSSSTTTTTTRRSPLRSRGRPRYTTTPRPESYESTTRVLITKRPLRERRPLPNRSRYETNKISTEKPIRKPLDSSESSTKSSRTRTRGRIHYRPSDNEDLYDRRKTHNSKEEDLAYQRDVLHQNYPVTLMERSSTVDIEAITEPTFNIPYNKAHESVAETYDTDNAYTHKKVTISDQEAESGGFDEKSALSTEASYVPNLPSNSNEEYYFQSRSSIPPVEISSYDDNLKEEDTYIRQTTPLPKLDNLESYGTESVATEQNVAIYNEYATPKQEKPTTSTETKNIELKNEENDETDAEDYNVQTTPSYNRVRVRPGVIRQYHQASTESTKTKEKKFAQPITYRPAFDKRRTTMRIDEIEADLKTKQVHVRPEQEYRHPIYKPESTTEPSTSSSTENANKRGHFRRRRPTYSYTTTSTEAASTKRVYEVKNRFRGRRPTDKPTEKSETQTEASTSTTRTSLHSRYSHRPKLSDRYNKNPEPEIQTEDQDSNFSINRPKYVEPETDQWSPKITNDSFKPFNPNDIVDEQKLATTERRSDKESEMDIITAKNEYEDILLTVTPASNNRLIKKMPDIPPTLEALVEQSKVTSSDSHETVSTFETMLEEVMKSLEEQDEDEYNSRVMKHKGGEIGEIPPERIITTDDSYVTTPPAPLNDIITTEQNTVDDSPPTHEVEQEQQRRRGFWKKVKVRPVTESIELAESQYYTNTVNRFGQPVGNGLKTVHEKTEKFEKPKVTTYKPRVQFVQELMTDDDVDFTPAVDIYKIKPKLTTDDEILNNDESKQTTLSAEKEAYTISPGDLDLGTGSPDPTMDDLYLTTTIPTTKVDRSDAFKFMDYLFGITSEDNESFTNTDENNSTTIQADNQITTEQPKTKIITTETSFIPEEITEAVNVNEDDTQTTAVNEILKVGSTNIETDATETTNDSEKIETTSVSSFMDVSNVLSTSMSTEISHETEICFRGKCIKTSRNIL